MITRMTMVCRSAAPLVTSGERTQAGILQTSVILSRWTPTISAQSQFCSVISPPPPASLDIKASTQLQRDLLRSPSSGEKKTPVPEIKWNFRSNHGFQCPSDLQLHSISLYYNKLQVDNQVMLDCWKDKYILASSRLLGNSLLITISHFRVDPCLPPIPALMERSGSSTSSRLSSSVSPSQQRFSTQV